MDLVSVDFILKVKRLLDHRHLNQRLDNPESLLIVFLKITAKLGDPIRFLAYLRLKQEPVPFKSFELFETFKKFAVKRNYL
jgi:hypothetical protein